MDLAGFANKSVVLTGATGFIGRHVVPALLRSPAAQVVLLSRSRPAPENLADPRVRWIEGPLEALRGDVWGKHGVQRIDIVFHLGAFTPKNAADAAKIDEVYTGNLLGTRALLDSLTNTPERVVFASSLDVYKQGVAEVIDEQSPVAPASLYGASKAFCEKLVETYCTQRGCAFSILRYGHIYGPGEEAYAKLIPQAIRALLQGNAPTVYGDGAALRDLLYVTDAVEATLRAAFSDVQALGPVNVVAGASHEIRSVAELLCKAAGHAGPVNFLRDRPNGPSFRFDNRKMVETLGRWDLVPLATGLKQEFEYMRGLA